MALRRQPLGHLCDLVDAKRDVVHTGAFPRQILPHGGVGIQGFGELQVGLSNLINGVFHAPTFVHLDFDRRHGKGLRHILHHRIGVMDQDPHVMHKLKHPLSLVNEVRRPLRPSLVPF